MSQPRTLVEWHTQYSKKGVRAKDGKDAGRVVGLSNQNIIIQKGVAREVILPKENVDALMATRHSSVLQLKRLKDMKSKFNSG